MHRIPRFTGGFGKKWSIRLVYLEKPLTSTTSSSLASSRTGGKVGRATKWTDTKSWANYAHPRYNQHNCQRICRRWSDRVGKKKASMSDSSGHECWSCTSPSIYINCSNYLYWWWLPGGSFQSGWTNGNLWSLQILKSKGYWLIKGVQWTFYL